jgi:hypothetical protein
MMPDPFAEAAAAIADSALGVDAVYTATTGLTYDCRVVLSKPEESIPGLGQPRGMVAPAVLATVPQAAIPEKPAEGCGLLVNGVAYAVAAPPEADPRAATWRLALRRA